MTRRGSRRKFGSIVLLSIAAATMVQAGSWYVAPYDYRDVSETYQRMADLTQRYPNLCELIDYGDSLNKEQGSASGFDLLAMKVSNKNIQGWKPVFFLNGATHGNEIASSEIALLFLEWMLDAYGRDPDVTAVVDWHESWIIPIVNPDGRARRLHPNARWVNINRNFDFKWTFGEGDGGSEPFSEPEARAMRDLVLQLFKTRRGTADTDAAPENTPGMAILLHTAGRLNLWPWSHTAGPAPNEADFYRIGAKLQTMDLYHMGQLRNILFQVDGGMDDWIYGKFGVACILRELMDSGFFSSPPYAAVQEEFWQRNRMPLLYAAKIAGAPYALVRGPDVFDVELRTEAGFRITATINGSRNGGLPIRAAELFIDGPPGVADPVLMQASDGSFDAVIEPVEVELSDMVLQSGRRHLLFVRGQNTAGNWGPWTAGFASLDAFGPITVESFAPGNFSQVLAYRPCRFEVKASSADERALTVSWHVDGREVTPVEWGTSEFTTAFAKAGQHQVTARISSGFRALEHTWNVTAVAPPDEIIVDGIDAEAEWNPQWYYWGAFWPWAGGAHYAPASAIPFRWRPDVRIPGTYGVYAWWPYGPFRSSSVPYRISDGSETVEVLVDQANLELSSRWNHLGDFTFAAGTNAFIEVSAENGEASADAVRFLLKSPFVQSVTPHLAVLSGDSAVLSLEVLGEPPLQYAWFKDGVLLPELHSSSLRLNSARASDAGEYRVHISNAHGTAESLPIRLTVIKPEDINLQITVEAGHKPVVWIPGSEEHDHRTILQRSFDLVAWDTVLDLPAGEQSSPFLPPVTAEQPARFYRLVVVPE